MKRLLLVAQIQAEYTVVQTYLDKGWQLNPLFVSDSKPYRLDTSTVWPLILYESEDEKPTPEFKPGEFDDVTDIKEASHNEVGQWIAKGYMVQRIDAKQTVLVLRSPKGAP